MTQPPASPKVYHITHVDNLTRIAASGELMSDRRILQGGGPAQAIGMAAIKRRRLEKLEVPCHPSTRVGDYVPFFFCPRSVMLYVIHRRNHPEMTYRGGQAPIVHLEADLRAAIRWSEAHERRWAFTLSNAGAHYAEFRSAERDLDQLDWEAIAASDFRDADVKEAKQAEFLVHSGLPIELIERIGVYSEAIRQRALRAISPLGRQPSVVVRREWYF